MGEKAFHSAGRRKFAGPAAIVCWLLSFIRSAEATYLICFVAASRVHLKAGFVAAAWLQKRLIGCTSDGLMNKSMDYRNLWGIRFIEP